MHRPRLTPWTTAAFQLLDQLGSLNVDVLSQWSLLELKQRLSALKDIEFKQSKSTTNQQTESELQESVDQPYSTVVASPLFQANPSDLIHLIGQADTSASNNTFKVNNKPLNEQKRRKRKREDITADAITHLATTSTTLSNINNTSLTASTQPTSKSKREEWDSPISLSSSLPPSIKSKPASTKESNPSKSITPFKSDFVPMSFVHLPLPIKIEAPPSLSPH